VGRPPGGLEILVANPGIASRKAPHLWLSDGIPSACHTRQIGGAVLPVRRQRKAVSVPTVSVPTFVEQGFLLAKFWHFSVSAAPL
jgi:hypothetical protein